MTPTLRMLPHLWPSWVSVVRSLVSRSPARMASVCLACILSSLSPFYISVLTLLAASRSLLSLASSLSMSVMLCWLILACHCDIISVIITLTVSLTDLGQVSL